MAAIPNQTGAPVVDQVPLSSQAIGPGQSEKVEQADHEDLSFEALALIQRVNARLNAVTPTPRSGVQQVA